MKTRLESRSQARFVINLTAVLKGQETANQEWEEVAEIYNISKNSIGFTLDREYQIGRLLCVTAQIPDEYRVEGHRQGVFYTVWGVVQHCARFGNANKRGKYYLGMALLGEKPPASYLSNPLQNYRLCGMQENGLWRVEEYGRKFVVRKYPRFSEMIEVFLGQLDDQSNMFSGEKVFTENISMGGLAVYSGLDLKIGDCVKIIATEYDFSALSIVRNITSKNNQKAKICLEFAAAKFPVIKLKSSYKDFNERLDLTESLLC